MNVVNTVKDKARRHRERHRSLGYQYVFADSVRFVNASDWDLLAQNGSIFLSRKYLDAIEQCSPENTAQRYALAYAGDQPLVLLACQIADISGEQIRQPGSKVEEKLMSQYQERVLVCGNLVSSGLHGILFAEQVDDEQGWRIVAEMLYKIRRSEKLSGEIDFVLIKDIKGEQIDLSSVIERFSFRRIQTDPDMVLALDPDLSDFNGYLQQLNTKYRNRIKKVIKNLEKGGFSSEVLKVDDAVDRQIHALYMNVERRSPTRLATLPMGYFAALAKNLGEAFVCHGIFREGVLVGFISVIHDGDESVAYYVGFDYEVNGQHPIYFRLLQLVIESAINAGSSKVLFGRSALEPKANLGAEPVDTFVWARHRVPVVNYFVRQLFRNLLFDQAPVRNVKKKPRQN